MFEIVRYTPDKADEWNQFVAQSKNGTFLFDRGYMDYHSDRFRDYSLMFYADGCLLAVLPAHACGDTLCTHRGLTYGGLLMSEKLTIAETMMLFREMNDILRAEGFRHVSYKAIPWIYHRLSAEEDLYALYHECKARIVARDYSTNIFLGANLRWERVRRRGIVRAGRAGLRVEISDSYGDFWRVLADNLGTKYGVRTTRNYSIWPPRRAESARSSSSRTTRSVESSARCFICMPRMWATIICTTTISRRRTCLSFRVMPF